ncbi:MAG: adenylosuccinate synthetase [Candidatus Buchananbacteria bacterium]|nr:adenylosuccinate synthetase [Candidatus Buchananbacteria bacterium]
MGKPGYGGVWIVRDPIFGDNGKARVVDHLTADPRVQAVFRWQGGDNAGHSVVFGNTEIDLHAIPAGVIRCLERPVMSVMGRGMVINPQRVLAEIERLRAKGIPVSPDNLLISEGAQLTLSFHMALEAAREAGAGKKGTTKKAISQTYGFARMYQGVRLGHLRNMDQFVRQVTPALDYTNAILTGCFGQEPISIDQVVAEVEACREQILAYAGNEIPYLNSILNQEGVILGEGAQAGMLDHDLGIYPYGTASNTWPGSIQSGVGVDPSWITEDYVVIKAYITRVGPHGLTAPMPERLATLIRERGHEYGVTTKRPRDIGWCDNMIGEFCATVGRGTKLVINKVDVLTNIHPLMVCTEYRAGGQVVDFFPTVVEDLDHITPVLTEFAGWTQDITGVTTWADLPENAQRYLEAISRPYQIPLTMVGTGPERSQIITL